MASTSYAASASKIVSNLDSLQTQAKAGTIKSITVTDGAFAALYVSAAKMLADADALKALTGTYTLRVSGTPTASDAVAIPSAVLAKVSGTIAISDSGANVLKAMTALLALAAANRIGSISFTDQTTPAFTLTCAQVKADAAVMLLLTSPATITINDKGTEVAGNLDTLQALTDAGTLTSIALSDNATTLTLTAAQAANDADAIGMISGSFTITVSDTGANIASKLDALQAMASAKTPLLTKITLTDKTPALSITATQLVNDGKALAQITNSSLAITVSGTLNLAQLGGLSATILDDIKSLSISDSDTDIAGDLNLGAKSVLLGLKNLGSIKLTSSASTPVLTIDADNIAGAAAVLAKISSNYVLSATSGTTLTVDAIKGLPSSILAKATSGLPVNDTASAISADIDALQKIAAKGLGTVAVSDGKALSISATQLATDSGVLAKLSGSWTVTPTGATTAAQATGLSAGVVKAITAGSLAVQDTGGKVLSALDKLETLAKGGALKSITLAGTGASDTNLGVTVAQVAKDGDALALVTGTNATLVVTGTTGGDTVDLSTIAIISDVTLGKSSATFTSNLSAGTVAMTNAADSVTLSAAAKATVHVTLNAGITEIFGFTLGTDTLDLTLGSTLQTDLTAISIKMTDGTSAVEIASAKDTAHGVLLVGYSGDTTTLLSDIVVKSGHATFN